MGKKPIKGKKAPSEQKQYIWEKEVSSITGDVALFVDWSEMKLTPKQLTYLITDSPKSPTEERSLVWAFAAQDILRVFEEHNLKNVDIDYVIQVAVDSYNRGIKIAIWKAMWTYVSGMHPDHFRDNIRITDIQKFLEK